MAALSIDFNCDVGEYEQPRQSGNDAQLLHYASSVNIACGGHAGNLAVMQRVAELAAEHEVAIGAHPGYVDREHFGRRALRLPPAQLFEQVAEQVAQLQQVCRSVERALHHVKPHGALYNQGADDAGLALLVARAIASVAPQVMLYGLANSAWLTAARQAGLAPVAEGFADRGYQVNGRLLPRGTDGALLATSDAVAAQALALAQHQRVQAVTGEWVEVPAQTLCVHGDGAQALAHAKWVHRVLRQHRVMLRAPCRDAK